LWNKRIDTDGSLGDINQRERGLLSDFNAILIKPDQVMPTITANGKFIDFNLPQHVSDAAIIKGQSFPSDYNFLGSKPNYLCGMSVPPIMTAQIATQIYKQWLSKI
jgi:DNA (cytosine-5)-methyltransferase 1